VIEDAGGIIVCDDICTGFKPFFDPIIPTHSTLTDMLIAIADKYLMHTCACFVPNTARIERLLKLVENFKIDGVVYYRLHCCHTYGAEEWRIRSALKAVNIPVLSIETDYSEGDIGQLKTRLEAFIEMLKARKE
jgi:benzoyl-CoA reductase/2-hydroxyglutaryl-CoA dehydratase subunit BcrC/BadD/HgdB